jgi:hypothetical protein
MPFLKDQAGLNQKPNTDFMKPHLLRLVAFLLLLNSASSAQSGCRVTNTAFSSGEELHFKVVYNWGAIWIESAEATFSVKSSDIKGRVCYKLNGTGFTYPKYAWFYKVQDVFSTYVDSESFRPLRFIADIHEGGKKEKHDYFFNNITQKVYTSIQRGKAATKVDSLKIGTCTIDVLSAIYYARNIDYSGCKPNDTISVSLLVDGKLFPIYVRYLGKAVFTSKELGKYNCIKFSPLLVEGTIFKGGEGMVVWVSDDKNKIPIYVETPLVIGTVKVKLIDCKGLRNPEDAKVK